MHAFTRTLLPIIALSFSLLTPSLAQSESNHPWVTPPPKLAPEAYFSNLKDGDTIETPFLVKFGLTGIGIAAITKAVGKTGHHHMLVNRDLPMDFSKPLPFTEQYIHFGKGQMETVVNFAPGNYTLRLVFADHRHIPNFVYSPPLTVRVAKKNEGIDSKSLIVPKVEILIPQKGEALHAPMRIVFHASGMNVSHTDIKDPNTGHFRLYLESKSGKTETIDLKQGSTEVWLRPPVGSYSARVELIDNSKPKTIMGSSDKIDFSIIPR